MWRRGPAAAVFAPTGEASGDPDGTHMSIDLSHLARQTMNDPDLQREVLLIFIEQLSIARRDLAAAEGDQRRRLAHKLKGAARAVGAFALADCAERIIERPHDLGTLEDLDVLAKEVSIFAVSLTDGSCR